MQSAPLASATGMIAASAPGIAQPAAIRTAVAAVPRTVNQLVVFCPI